jgi:hypothetical protein
MPKLYTTLNDLSRHVDKNSDDWPRLLSRLGKRRPDDEPLALATVLECGDINDAAWCLRALPEEYDGLVRLFLADVAERVLPLLEAAFPDEPAPRKAIQAARDYAAGRISAKKLAAARVNTGDEWVGRDAQWAADNAETKARWASRRGSAPAAKSAAKAAALLASGLHAAATVRATVALAGDARAAARSGVWNALRAAAWAAPPVAYKIAITAESAAQKQLFIKYFCEE